MTKIFVDAEEKFLSKVVVYAKADDEEVCYDTKKTNPVPKAELMNLLMKGIVLIKHEDAFYVPANFSDKTTHIEVNVSAEAGWLTFKSKTEA